MDLLCIASEGSIACSSLSGGRDFHLDEFVVNTRTENLQSVMGLRQSYCCSC